MRIYNKLFFTLLFVLISCSCFAQRKLNSTKEELKKEPEKKSNNNSTGSNSDGSDESIFAVFYVFKAAYLFSIGSYNNENHLHHALAKYPFVNNYSGNYLNTENVEEVTNIIRIDIEDKFLISHDNMIGNHVKLKLRPGRYLFFQGEQIQLIEIINKVRKEYDNLSLYNFSFCYDRLRFEKVNIGWTVGLNYIANDIKSSGFSYGLQGEVFIAKHFSTLFSAKHSHINNNPVNNYEVSLKYHVNRFYLTSGYELINVAGFYFNYLGVGAGIYL